MDLTVIIVNWNTRELTRQCLVSLHNPLPELAVEIFVVDNASSDGSPQMIRDHFPQVRLVENSGNLGFATANNQAVRLSSGRNILLLNSDTIVKPGAIEKLVGFMEASPHAGAAGARLLNPDGSQQYSCSPTPTLGREIKRMFHLPGVRSDGYYEMKNWETSQPVKVDVLLGACLLLRRQVLEQVGLLDEGYFMYTEEVDLCYRIQEGGWQLYWIPQAEVIHYGGQSTHQASQEMFSRLYESKVRYFRRHHGNIAMVEYKLVLVGASIFRLLLFPLAWLLRPARRKTNQAQAENYLRLLVNVAGM